MDKYLSKFMREKLGLDASGIEKLVQQMQSGVKNIESEAAEVRKNFDNAKKAIESDYKMADAETRKRYDSYMKAINEISEKLDRLVNSLYPMRDAISSEAEGIKDGCRENQEPLFDDSLSSRIRRNAESAEEEGKRSRQSSVDMASELIEKQRDEIGKIKRKKNYEKESGGKK